MDGMLFRRGPDERFQPIAVRHIDGRREKVRGLIDANLGRGLIKQRVAREGAGRRGGFRTIVAYRVGSRAVFIFGFAKNARENISAADERDLADAGALLLGLDPQGIETMIHGGELWEVECDDEKDAEA
jgi:hypothetical protein